MYNILTETGFGDIRSSVERQSFPLILQNLRKYHETMPHEDLLRYIKSKLGFIPSHDWVCHYCSSDPFHAYSMRKHWLEGAKPLKAFITVSNQRYCIAEWEDPFPVLFPMLKKYRDSLIRSFSNLWLNGLTISRPLVTSQELEYIHKYNEATTLDEVLAYREVLQNVLDKEPRTLRYASPHCKALYNCLDPRLCNGIMYDKVVSVLGEKPSYLLMRSVDKVELKSL